MRYIFLILLFIPTLCLSQEMVSGMVMEVNDKNEHVGVMGANVFWLDTSVGVVTDIDGRFAIPYKKEYTKLVISYVGYRTDTIEVNGPRMIHHLLQADGSLDEVNVTTRRKASSTSFLEAANTINVSSAELLKAACCNLAESFETNPSIDVNFVDAISGTRQIKMLGLTSPYILITTENIPAIRGASQTYGLSFIPGTWVESIQITKGSGSVVQGYESITGQINAELQKPAKDDKLFINAYASMSGRFELNTHINTKVTERWSTGLYIHGNLRSEKFDKNNDGFMDVPLAEQVNVMNRWQYQDTENGLISFINLRYLNDRKQAGQLEFDPDRDRMTTNFWGSEVDTERVDAMAKLGLVDPDVPYNTGAVQLAYSRHRQDSYFGLNQYDITHNSLYTTVNFNSIIGDTRHKFKSGLTFTYDDYEELVVDTQYGRKENSLGAFFEYAYDDLDALTFTAGMRVDNHNILGLFLTPRFHIRYATWDRTVIRASVGRGKRSASIFTENQRLFATSRQIQISGGDGGIYGLDPEIAWNYGISLQQGFYLFQKRADIVLDFYRTQFQNQIIVDWEDRLRVEFYNLEGESFSNIFQAEFNYTPFEHIDLRLAYKYFDVQTDYKKGRLDKPLTPKHRLFANVSVETHSKNETFWKFDATFNWLSEQRFPDTGDNPLPYQLDDYTPTVGTLNAQLTKVFSNSFEVYLGGENITNLRQSNPIVSSDNPFGPNFDTTFVYGPVFGSMYYTGLRYKLN